MKKDEKVRSETFESGVVVDYKEWVIRLPNGRELSWSEGFAEWQTFDRPLKFHIFDAATRLRHSLSGNSLRCDVALNSEPSPST